MQGGLISFDNQALLCGIAPKVLGIVAQTVVV
jgi:hypothetical protein